MLRKPTPIRLNLHIEQLPDILLRLHTKSFPINSFYFHIAQESTFTLLTRASPQGGLLHTATCSEHNKY